MFIPKADKFNNELNEHNHILISLHSFKKGYISKLHWHDFFELEIVVAGNGLHTLNDKQYEISPGSTYLLTYNDFHLLNALSDLKVLNIAFVSNAVSKELLQAVSTGGISLLGSSELDSVTERLELLEHTKNKDVNLYDILSKCFLEELIIRIILKHTTTGGAQTPSAVQRCIMIITENFRDDISLEYVAKKLFVSPNYLGLLFKKAVGSSFRSYLNAIRIRCACNLLATTNKSVKEIASDCGYNSFEHFTYTFKKNMQLSANEYRKKVKSIIHIDTYDKHAAHNI